MDGVLGDAFGAKEWIWIMAYRQPLEACAVRGCEVAVLRNLQALHLAVWIYRINKGVVEYGDVPHPRGVTLPSLHPRLLNSTISMIESH